VRATGLIQHKGRSTAVAMGELRGIEDGRIYATGSTTCLVMRPG
jgi:acyl-coenzyme A thioesterase PaaI-like protein